MEGGQQWKRSRKAADGRLQQAVRTVVLTVRDGAHRQRPPHLRGVPARDLPEHALRHVELGPGLRVPRNSNSIYQPWCSV